MAGNNGTFTVTASTSTTITYANASGTSAGTGGGTHFTIPGFPVASGYLQPSGSGGGFTDLDPFIKGIEVPIMTNIPSTTGDVYTLAVEGIGGTVTCLGSLQWAEDR